MSLQMSGLEDDIDIIKSLIAMCKEGYLPLEKVDCEYISLKVSAQYLSRWIYLT